MPEQKSWPASLDQQPDPAAPSNSWTLHCVFVLPPLGGSMISTETSAQNLVNQMLIKQQVTIKSHEQCQLCQAKKGTHHWPRSRRCATVDSPKWREWLVNLDQIWAESSLHVQNHLTVNVRNISSGVMNHPLGLQGTRQVTHWFRSTQCASVGFPKL